MAELIPGEENLRAPFQRKITAMATRLGANPDDLLGIMSFETGSSFSPSVRNQAGSGATGLIQFMPGTAEALGTSTDALARMSPEQQLDMVEKYLTPYKGRLRSLKDTYMAVLYPEAVGQPDHTVLFREGTKAYLQNKGLDQGRKGYITVGDATARVQRHAGGNTKAAQRTALDQEIDQEIARVRSRHADDLSVPYIEDKNRQIDTEMQQELRKLRPLEALGAGVIASRTATQPEGTATPAPATLGERLSVDALQVMGGMRDAVVNTLDLIPGVGDWIEDHVKEIPKTDTVEGPLLRGASQFLISFLPALRAVKALGVTGQVTSGMVAGAISDFAAFDPNSPRVSNVINTLAPALRNPLTEYLAASPEDSEAEGRFKNALEGLALGAVTEGLFRLGKLMWRARKVRGDVDQTIKQALPDDLPEGSVQARVMGEGEDVGVRPQVTDEEIAQQLSRPPAEEAPGAAARTAPPPLDPERVTVGYFTDPTVSTADKLDLMDQILARRAGRASDETVEETVGWFRDTRIADEDKQAALARILAERQGGTPPPAQGTRVAEGAPPPAQAARAAEGVPPPAQGARAAEEAAVPPVSRMTATTDVRVSEAMAAKLAASGDDLITVGPATREHAQQFQTLTASGAAETLSREGRVAHINFDRFQTGDDLARGLRTMAEVMKDATDVQRRGTMTVPEIAALAEQSPYREVDRILGIGPGTALPTEHALAVRKVFLAAGERLHALSRELAQGNLGVAETWLKQFVLTANIHTRRAGIEAETGRAMRIFGVDMPSTEKYFLDNLAAIMTNTTPEAMEETLRSVGAAGASQYAMQLAQQITGLTTPQQFAAAALALQQQYTPQQLASLSKQQHLAAMLAQLTTPEQLATFMRQAQGITRADMFSELWYGALLSAPPTHSTNMLDSALRTFRAIPERYFTTVTGNPRELSLNFRAANAFTYGLQRGLQEAWGYAANAWRTGASQFGDSGKVAAPRIPAFTAQNLGIQGSMLGHFADFLGAAARLPGRGLLAADEFFKVINYRMQLHESAFRQAVDEGYEGEGLARQILAYTDNPLPEMHAKATAWAQYQTLGQPLDEAGAAFEGLGRYIASWEAGGRDFFPAKVILPFIRTPFNIVRNGLEYVPGLGNLSMNINKALIAGGAEGALARSKMALGGMSMAMFSMMAMENVITGKAPADPGLRQTWERLGLQEYSIWVPFLNKYVAYNRIDAVGLVLGLAADFVQIARDAPIQNLEQLAGAAVGALFYNVTSKTWLKAVADLVDAITPGRGETPGQTGADFARYFRRLMASLAQPVAAVTLAARMLDPQQRQTRDVFDAFLARVPGMSRLLPPELDRWARPRLRSEPLGPDIVSPFMSRDYTPDAVDDELFLQKVPVTMPERTIRIPRAGSLESEAIPLSPWQYNRYVELSVGLGPGMTPLKEALADLIASDLYRHGGLSDGPRGGKSALILDLFQQYEQAAKAHLAQEDPAVAKLLEDKAISRVLMRTNEGQAELRRRGIGVGAPR